MSSIKCPFVSMNYKRIYISQGIKHIFDGEYLNRYEYPDVYEKAIKYLARICVTSEKPLIIKHKCAYYTIFYEISKS